MPILFFNTRATKRVKRFGQTICDGRGSSTNEPDVDDFTVVLYKYNVLQ